MIYTPQGCKTLAEQKQAQIRLGLQGYGGEGKTWAALTFPNPVVVSFDRGLGAHYGRSDIIEVPFYDDAFVSSLIKRAIVKPGDAKDAFLIWLDKEARKFTDEQTLVVDNNTSIQNIYHKWADENPVVSSSGRIDPRAEWGMKLDFYKEFVEMFKKFKCHVVYICHEMDAKDKVTGEYNGKLRPLISGQFGEEIVNHFTDWFRQLSADKPTDITDDKLKNWGMTKKEFMDMCATYPRNTIYFWQTDSDSTFSGKCSSLRNFPKYIPAHYNNFRRYMAKQVSPTT